jgi:hypothetical protein
MFKREIHTKEKNSSQTKRRLILERVALCGAAKCMRWGEGAYQLLQHVWLAGGAAANSRKAERRARKVTRIAKTQQRLTGA